jgi:hypothetical protein
MTRTLVACALPAAESSVRLSLRSIGLPTTEIPKARLIWVMLPVYRGVRRQKRPSR